MSFYALVGDIGGTNARFALVEKGGLTLHHIEVLACQDYQNFDDALQSYYQKCAVKAPEIACISFACPIEEEIKMTNNHWAFNVEKMQKKLKLKQFKLLNDFTAMAYGTLFVADANKVLIQAGDDKYADTSRLVIGPGTGLGVSSLISVKEHSSTGSRGWQAVATEGGHMTFAPQTELELQVLQHLQAKYQRVSAERILSGDGIVALYIALCDIKKSPVQYTNAAQVTHAALAVGEQANPLAALTLHTFCEILGAVTGDLVLAQGARGGVYLCGGILPRIEAFFQQSQFTQQMCNKGRMSDYLSSVPVWLCAAKYPGLLGAAAALKL